jgi:hypothetical protein
MLLTAQVEHLTIGAHLNRDAHNGQPAAVKRDVGGERGVEGPLGLVLGVLLNPTAVAVLVAERGRALGRDVAREAYQVLHQPITLDRTTFVSGASIGLAVGESAVTATDLLRNADLAMYRAKGEGKNQVDSLIR